MRKVKDAFSKTSDGFQQAIAEKIKKYVLGSILDKFEPLINVLNAIVFIVTFVIASMLVSLLLLLFKATTDATGDITYGSLMLGLIVSLILGIMIGFIAKSIVAHKIKSVKDEITNSD